MEGASLVEDKLSCHCASLGNNRTPCDNLDTDKVIANQELESTQDCYLGIALDSETCDSDSRSEHDCKDESIENRKCNRYESLANPAIPVQGDETTGSVSIAVNECRICQSSGDEALINPCKCSGSAKWVHESCMVKWFQISETSSCELCARDVSIKKKTKPLYQWRLPRGDLGPCSKVDLWYLFVTIFSICTIVGFGIFHLLVKSKEPETTAVFGAIYALCGVMIVLRIHYFYMWFTKRSAFWRKWKTMNRVWTVVSPRAVLKANGDVSIV